MPKQVCMKNVKTAWKRSESTLPLRQWARSEDGIAWLGDFVSGLADRYKDNWEKVLEANGGSGEVTPKVAVVTGNEIFKALERK